MKSVHFGPKAVDLSGTETLGPLSNAMVTQPPAPMPRKSQVVSGQAPSSLPLCPGQERVGYRPRAQRTLSLLPWLGWGRLLPGHLVLRIGAGCNPEPTASGLGPSGSRTGPHVPTRHRAGPLPALFPRLASTWKCPCPERAEPPILTPVGSQACGWPSGPVGSKVARFSALERTLPHTLSCEPSSPCRRPS